MLSGMRTSRCFFALVVLCALSLGAPPSSAAPLPSPGAPAWQWPVDPHTIVEPYRAPAHRYGPGHRGIDLAAPVGADITAPADGVVAFSGSVAGRPIVTIDHGDGLVTTLEPVAAAVPLGAVVRAGDSVGSASKGGHARVGTVHFGVREHGEYINPLVLFGDIPRAVLLPCC